MNEADELFAGRLAEAGWIERPGGPRLIRGERPRWRPEWIYGQFTGALG